MRQLTAYASYLDNLGAPLVGRARFYSLDDSPAEVFGMDNAHREFVSIGSVVFTNSSGQLDPQVFLDNHDYLIVFDKYVGHGTMSEDDDPESWEEQGSAVDRYNTLGVELVGDTVRKVDTIADLRSSMPLQDGEVILLLGYSDSGDKPAIYYKWNESSTDQDNGGSVIKVAGQERGRWVFIECPAYLDVRHFGAFPTSAVVADDTQKYAIQNAAGYAHANSCGIYFPANDTAAYYDISGLNLYDVDCSPNARVFAQSSSYGTTITGIRKIYCTSDISCKGIIRLVDEVVRSSWEGDSGSVSLAPTARLVIDKALNNTGVRFRNIEVEFLVYSRLYLENCQVVSNKKIDSYITLEGCEIESSWFVDGYDWRNLTSINNRIRLQNCDSADTYITLKNKQSEADYGDLGEQTVTGKTLLANCIAENAFFDGVTISGNSELHNVSGTVTISASATKQTWLDCWLTVSSDFVVDELSLHRGMLAGGKVSVLSRFTVHDADILVPVDLLGAVPDVRRCKVSKKVLQKDNAGVITGTFEDCTFEAEHELDPVTADTIVNVVWRNNYATVVPITVVDNSKLKAGESNHGYVYDNNVGMFLPTEAEYVEEIPSSQITMLPYSSSHLGYGKINLVDPNLIIPTVGVRFFTGIVIGIDSHPITLFNLTGRLDIRMEGDVLLQGITSDWYDQETTRSYSVSIPLSAASYDIPVVNASFVNGFWKAFMVRSQSETADARLTLRFKRA